jgi:hypothetical protein
MIPIFGLLGCKTDTKLIEEKTESGIKLIYKPKISIYSGSQMRIFPKNPEIMLQREVAISLINYLSKELPNKELNIELDSTINFVDCGEEFEKVVCTNCGKEISMEFWQESMDKASQTKFKDLTITTLCCQMLADLNSLKYHSDCGFAKSLITIIGPDPMINEPKILSNLKSLSGFDFKIIYVKI